MVTEHAIHSYKHAKLGLHSQPLRTDLVYFSRKPKFNSQLQILSFYVPISLSSFPLVLLLFSQVSQGSRLLNTAEAVSLHFIPSIPFSRAKPDPWFFGNLQKAALSPRPPHTYQEKNSLALAIRYTPRKRMNNMLT